jgi:hypothetical protein
MGRIEQAVNRTLREPSPLELPDALKAGLRFLARQMDDAEAQGDRLAAPRLAHEFLEMMQAAGLAGATHDAIDPFAAFVAGLSAPSLGDEADA